MSDIVKIYLRVLEVISSLNCELEYKSDVGLKNKIIDLEVVAEGFDFFHDNFVLCVSLAKDRTRIERMPRNADWY